MGSDPLRFSKLKIFTEPAILKSFVSTVVFKEWCVVRYHSSITNKDTALVTLRYCGVTDWTITVYLVFSFLFFMVTITAGSYLASGEKWQVWLPAGSDL